MKQTNTIIQLVQRPVEQFLAHQLPAAELVRIVDDLVAQDRLDGLNARDGELVSNLHEALALYVPDERTRQEEPGIFIGEDDLRRKAAKFIAGLGPSAQAEGKE